MLENVKIVTTRPGLPCTGWSQIGQPIWTKFDQHVLLCDRETSKEKIIPKYLNSVEWFLVINNGQITIMTMVHMVHVRNKISRLKWLVSKVHGSCRASATHTNIHAQNTLKHTHTHTHTHTHIRTHIRATTTLWGYLLYVRCGSHSKYNQALWGLIPPPPHNVKKTPTRSNPTKLCAKYPHNFMKTSRLDFYIHVLLYLFVYFHQCLCKILLCINM